MRDAICIIPARGGSKRIPRKNIKDFRGHPIIAYSIMAAQKSDVFEKIYVSTEDGEIGDISEKYGAILHKRPKELADSKTGTFAVVKDFVGKYNCDDLLSINYVCCLYATCPLINPFDIQTAYQLLSSSKDQNHIISIGYPPLQDAAQIYFSQTDAILHDIQYFDYDTGLLRIAENRVCDINTMEDWENAERMYDDFNRGKI
jgi:pseudaminic acid cytidylyltransferase